MNCSEFERCLRAEGGNPEDVGLAAHAVGCTQCRSLLDDDQFVTGALELLRTSLSAVSAPDDIEQRLLAEFRAPRPQAASRDTRSGLRLWRPWLAAAAIFIAGVIVAFLALRSETSGPARAGGDSATEPAVPAAGPSVATTDAAPPSAVRQLMSSQPAEDVAAQSPVGRSRGRPSGPGRAGARKGEFQSAARIEATPFFATMLMSGNEPMSDLRLVRVPVSRRTLEEFGLVTNPLHPDRPVKADLLIGPDGLTRAIRFVSEVR